MLKYSKSVMMIKICFFLLIYETSGIKILRNTVHKNETLLKTGGATVLNPKVNEEEILGLTVCMRFNLETLTENAGAMPQSRILTIGK